MKAVLIIVAILLIGFVTIQLFAMKSRSNIESYPYSVINKYEDIEVRRYEASLFTSVELDATDYETASGEGFSKLAGYIFGGNESEEKISMTSPVTMSIEDNVTMMFMVPKKYEKSDLPKPNRSDIEFQEIPAKQMAAIRFGGWASTTRITEYKIKLKAALDKEGIAYTDQFYFFGYNPPYDVIGRRNEVVVELIP